MFIMYLILRKILYLPICYVRVVKLILSKNEIIVGKRYVIDGMYKLIIINEDVSGCAYIVDSSYLCHARLGLLNFEYLKFTSSL